VLIIPNFSDIVMLFSFCPTFFPETRKWPAPENLILWKRHNDQGQGAATKAAEHHGNCKALE
jgi:hypothetical protein